MRPPHTSHGMRRACFSRARWVMAIALGLAVLALTNLTADALTESVTFEDLKVRKILNLPTVSSQQVVPFTIPKTWRVSEGASYVEIEFQHSSELQPHRSWIEVIVNERSLMKTALTASNAKATKLRVPLGRVRLKDKNTLKIRVEQHYTDRCEDPLDPSLWTQVLTSSRLVFNYTPVLPSIDLSAYPFPIIDPLAYTPVEVLYSLPESPALEDLQTLAHLTVNLGQWAQDKSVYSRLDKHGQDGSRQHLILIGTPETNPRINSFANRFHSYGLQNQRWIDKKRKKPIADKAGLLFYFRHPSNPALTTLIVTGNTPKGVLQAVQYLTFRPTNISLEGQEYLVTDNWQPKTVESRAIPRFIENETRTLKELGFGLKRVEKINAPPITYPISVVSDFDAQKSDASMALKLIYSYGPGVNPEFSSLEIRLNDRSVGNIPLLKEQGEERAEATLRIPNELIQPHNKLVAQYHMLPDKYGFCVDNYVDKAWGKIHEESELIVKGKPASRLPDVGLLNNTGFPYSRKDNLESLHIVIPANPPETLMESMMAVLTRLGRATVSDTDLRMSLATDFSSIPGERDVLAFLHHEADDFASSLARHFHLNWEDPTEKRQQLTKHLQLANQKTIEIQDAGSGAYMEQQIIAAGSGLLLGDAPDRILTRFTGKDSDAFTALRQLFEEDRRFEKLTSGLIKQLDPQAHALNTIHGYQPEAQPSASPSSSGGLWSTLTRWASEHPFLAGFTGLFLFVVLFLVFSFILMLLRPRRPS